MLSTPRSGPFRDRIYAAWNDIRSGHPQILFSYSADRGQTWSAPHAIGNAASQAADQFQPSMAVNVDDTLAMTWYDTRASTNRTEFHEYFAASIDGGASFLPEVRVSSASSRFSGEGNLALTPTDFRTADSWRINLLSAASRWGNGGDYMGLCADARGVFHPFWANARSGTFQIWTAAVQVNRPGAPGTAASDNVNATGRSSSAVAAPARVRVPLRTRVELLYDPTRYDSSSGTLEMPVRLRNVSTAPIYPPISIEIVKFGSGLGEDDKESAPRLLNATNGNSGVGAIFDYSGALRDWQALEPQAVSGAVVWKMILTDPLRSPNIHIEAAGMVER